MAIYKFNSDNGAPVCDQVMDALVRCNHGVETAYGADRWSQGLDSAYSDFFEKRCFVFPVPTGTAGNGLALGAVTPPYGTMFSHAQAHIVTTEGGAPEFYSGGGRITLIDGADNKITADALRAALDAHGIGNVHHMHASALCLTQATETGVTYTLDELAELSAIARQAGLKVHMDGARFANALVHLGATPAEMTWKAGVDLLTFGTTKNGTMNAEAVITFDPEIARVLRVMHKRAGHLSSKMRYMSAQLLSYLEGDLWRRNAARANGHATRVARALGACDAVRLMHPVHINEVFAVLPPALAEHLKAEGFPLRPWSFGERSGVRIVLSFADSDAEVDAFADCLRRFR
ncbi:threonine aldolase family protein [Ponticoccus sp. (in: a-proteobacteria)]|uniref:threonine aldolase family protein n=1 Tax=Ponticoccus sp. (in: a-proteobacteria) TaxID=1925025 RepID=UPI003AB85730